MKAEERETFVHNLGTAVAKAGGKSQLANILEASNASIHNWSKVPPRNITQLVLNLAKYLELTDAALLYTTKIGGGLPQKLDVVTATRNKVADVLAVMQEVRSLRDKYNWATIEVWFQKIRALHEMVGEDWDGLMAIMENMRPVTKGKKETTKEEPQP